VLRCQDASECDGMTDDYVVSDSYVHTDTEIHRHTDTDRQTLRHRHRRQKVHLLHHAIFALQKCSNDNNNNEGT